MHRAAVEIPRGDEALVRFPTGRRGETEVGPASVHEVGPHSARRERVHHLIAQPADGRVTVRGPPPHRDIIGVKFADHRGLFGLHAPQLRDVARAAAVQRRHRAAAARVAMRAVAIGHRHLDTEFAQIPRQRRQIFRRPRPPDEEILVLRLNHHHRPAARPLPCGEHWHPPLEPPPHQRQRRRVRRAKFDLGFGDQPRRVTAALPLGADERADARKRIHSKRGGGIEERADVPVAREVENAAHALMHVPRDIERHRVHPAALGAQQCLAPLRARNAE